MKKKSFFILLMVLAFLTSCKTITETVYVPVETVKTEYKYLYALDSVYIHDSITTYILTKNDTVYVDREKIKYVYKYENVSDTIIKVDSIPVIKEVEKIVETNKLNTLQKVLCWLGGISALILLIKVALKFKP